MATIAGRAARCLGGRDVVRIYGEGHSAHPLPVVSARSIRHRHSLVPTGGSLKRTPSRIRQCSRDEQIGLSMCAVHRLGKARLYSEDRSRLRSEKDEEFRRDTGQVPLPSKTTQAVTENLKAAKSKVLSSIPKLTPHENIYNLPNILTVSRLFAAPATAYLLLHDHHKWALALFAYAGVTDLVDGWIARRWKLQTVAGSVIDPMADKALMIVLTVTLAIKGALPLSLATLILGRDASLALAAIYYRYASLPNPKTFMRYWDFSLPSAEVHPTTVSKYNTFLQLILIGSTLTLPLLTTGGEYAHLINISDHALKTGMTAFQCLVAGTTAWSGLSYAFLKKAVTILGDDEVLKAKQGARGRAIIGVTFGTVVAAALWIAIDREQVPIKAEKSAVDNAD